MNNLYQGASFECLWWALEEDTAKLIARMSEMDEEALEELLEAAVLIVREAEDALDRILR